MIVKTSQQWFKINGKNAFECPLRLGLYLKVECMNLSETNISRLPESEGISTFLRQIFIQETLVKKL